MSSSTWKDSFVQGGIFEDSPAKSPLAGATKAFVPYCTSDAWVGDAEAYGFQFRGQRIVGSTLAAFVQKQGLGSAPGHRLVFGGCSAGGRGASFNLDYVPQILADAGAAYPVTVVGLFDAAMWVDIPPALPSIVSQQCQTAALLEMVNATKRLGDECLAAYPDPTEQWKWCALSLTFAALLDALLTHAPSLHHSLYGQYRLPYIQLPYILQASQLDVFQIEINVNGDGTMAPPVTPAQFAWAQQFQAAAKKVLAGLPTAAQKTSAVFSPSCFHHCVTDAAGMWNIVVQNRTFADAFSAWFLSAVAPLRVVDACSGWRCGTCSAKRSLKGGKLKPGHGNTSPAAVAAEKAARGTVVAVAPPPAPSPPDKWGWSVAQNTDPLPAICVEAGLNATSPVEALTEAMAPAAAVEQMDAFKSSYHPWRGQLGTQEDGAGAAQAGPVATTTLQQPRRRSTVGDSSRRGHRLALGLILFVFPAGVVCVWRATSALGAHETQRHRGAASPLDERRTLL